jgi:hypothetical protein
MKKFLTHPENLERLKRHFGAELRASSLDLLSLGGIAIETNPLMPVMTPVKTGRVFVPRERFIQYEHSDLDWLLYFGIAKEEIVMQPYIVEIDTNAWRMVEMPLGLIKWSA